jgi:hypothetical protein
MYIHAKLSAAARKSQLKAAASSADNESCGIEIGGSNIIIMAKISVAKIMA